MGAQTYLKHVIYRYEPVTLQRTVTQYDEVTYGTCQGYVEPCVFGEGEGYYDKVDMEFGFMYYAMIYPDEAEKDEDKGFMTACFCKPEMKNGIIKFTLPSDIPLEHKRHIKKMEIKKFGTELDNFSGLDEFVGGEFDELD